MEISLLRKEYLKGDSLYDDFVNDKIDLNETEEHIFLDNVKYFPIYMANMKNSKKLTNTYMEAFKCMENVYLKFDRELVMDEQFWHSLLITEFRDEILVNYPEIKDDRSKFRNIVKKKFDWENYIYKVILGAQYIFDNVKEEGQREKYYRLIVNNLDVYNYIIKYEIFRNDKFLINILDIIDRNDLSNLLKKKIKGREDLGEDERYGRRVIYEFNKSYPVLLSPMMSYEDLERQFHKFLETYM